MREHVRKQAGDEGVALASLVETMSDRLFFTVISVTDELNAYKVFETLNARGVRLSSTDLLKNYLFSVLHKQHGEHPHEMQALEDRWESMVTRLGAESFPDFLRSHWNSRRTFVRTGDLFKSIRGKVSDRSAVFDLLRGMEADMDTYLALTNPEASHWPEKLKASAQQLRMFRVRQSFPLILAAARHLDQEDLGRVLRGCVVIAFRYNVIGNLPTNDQERVYYSAAQKILVAGGAGSVTANAILESLHEIYPRDEAFRLAFSEKVIRTSDSRNNRVVRYILCALEHQHSGQDLEFESATFNIEHVLPQNPALGWEQFSEEEIESMTYRLGNMALLTKGANKDLGNATYDAKRPAYQASKFGLTQKLGDENDHWSPERIDARQKGLAKLATAVWRIDQLS